MKKGFPRGSIVLFKPIFIRSVINCVARHASGTTRSNSSCVQCQWQRATLCVFVAILVPCTFNTNSTDSREGFVLEWMLKQRKLSHSFDRGEFA
jgi:hypothetical protein